MGKRESTSDFKAQYVSMCDRIDSLSLIMRLLMFVALGFLIYFIWLKAAGEPQLRYAQTLGEKIASTQTQIQTLHAKSASILRGKDIKTDKKSIARIQQEISSLNQRIQQSGSIVFSVKNMAAVLKEMLTKQQRLYLLSVKHLSSKTMVSAGQGGAGVFQQNLELIFEGDYFGTLRFLRHLEQLKWRTFFDQLSYTVLQYPEAKIILKLHTYSRERN